MLDIRNNREFQAVLRTKLPYYIGKVFNTVEPVPYQHNWHVDLISEYLQAILDGELTRLIINVPPGYTKSIAVNVAFSTRLLGKYPKHRVLSASHSFSLSTKMSIKAKMVMESAWYKELFPATVLKKDVENTQSYFKTTQEGLRQAVSVGGKITGEGGDCLVGSTLISTDDGEKTLDYLIDNYKKLKVYSYNHLLDREEKKSILAFRKLKKRGIYEIQTNEGNTIRGTGDHLIFVKGEGYVQIRNLVEGNGLLGITQKASRRNSEYIAKIIYNGEAEEHVYDIQVKDNKNFYANGVLVHNCLIIDDPIDASDANASSGILLQKCNDWFDSVFYSRLRDKKKGAIILIAQRLHQNDLTGHLLASANSDFEHCVIPVIEDTKGGKTYSYKNFKKFREEDNILFPAIEDEKELDRAKIRLGKYGFSGQYQQKPSPAGGGIFKEEYWQYYDILPQLKYSIIVGDTAQKTKEINDYSVFECWGEGVDGNAYLIDIVRGKWEFPELETVCVAFWNKHKSNTQIKLRMLYIEDKSSGTGLIQKIKKTYKIPIYGIKRDSKDKVERVSGIIGYIESGYVYLKKNAHWLSDFLFETSLFPNASHDDQVDPLTDAVDIIYNSKKEYNVRII